MSATKKFQMKTKNILEEKKKQNLQWTALSLFVESSNNLEHLNLAILFHKILQIYQIARCTAIFQSVHRIWIWTIPNHWSSPSEAVPLLAWICSFGHFFAGRWSYLHLHWSDPWFPSIMTRAPVQLKRRGPLHDAATTMLHYTGW